MVSFYAYKFLEQMVYALFVHDFKLSVQINPLADKYSM